MPYLAQFVRHTWHPFLSVPPECDGCAEAISGAGRSTRENTHIAVLRLMFLTLMGLLSGVEDTYETNHIEDFESLYVQWQFKRFHAWVLGLVKSDS